MKKMAKFWKLFGKNDKHQTNTEVEFESNSNVSETETENISKEIVNIKSNMKENKAHIYNLIIVDESGSMASLREVTLSGINETINTIKKAQKDYSSTQEHTLTLVTFDSGSDRPNVRTIIDNKSILEVDEFKDYAPNGCTPLYDAVGQSLTTLYNRIKDDSDATAVVTVLTDGLENDSKDWDAISLRRLIEKLKIEGWSFSYMGSAHDVKEVTEMLSIENVVEFTHDTKGACNTWVRERSSRSEYYRKMNVMYSEEGVRSREDMQERKRQYAKEYYGQRVTPGRIENLEVNEIFVFGSNANGFHSGGAAAHAMRNFGAIWGRGEGPQGQSYAIPTMEGIAEMHEAIKRFTMYAAEHPNMRFLVTRIGCGIAGYSATQIAPLFKECINLENVALPSDFWEVLGLKMY